MALAAQNSQTSRHSYTARPSRDYLLEDDYGPPFLAEAVRLNAIENIRSYQSLTLRRVSDENDSDPAEGLPVARGPGSEGTSNPELDRLIRRKIVQGMLMNDLNRLLQRILVLEQSLTSKRTTAWITQILLAAGTHLVLQNSAVNRFLARTIYFIPPLFFLVGYPVAIARLWTFELSVRSTERVREGLENLQRRVGMWETLYDSETGCLGGDDWSRVPWKDVEID